MNPRTLQQILTELNPVYDPQVQSIQGQQAALPGQIQAQEQGLQAKQGEAFDSIMSGAQNRGVGFSGVPLGEQAKYTASSYLPALANLRTAGTQQATSLQDAINQINERKNTFAQQLYGADQDRYQTLMAQQRAEASQRAAASAQNAGLSALFNQENPAQTPPNNQAAAKPAGTSLQSYLAQQYAKQPNAPRALQDQWVRMWASQTGKNANDASVWAAYNKLYPWEQYNDAARDPNKSTSVNYGSAARNIGSQAGNLGSSLLSRLKSNAGIFSF